MKFSIFSFSTHGTDVWGEAGSTETADEEIYSILSHKSINWKSHKTVTYRVIQTGGKKSVTKICGFKRFFCVEVGDILAFTMALIQGI